MADWNAYMQAPNYQGLVNSNAQAGAAVNQGLDTAFKQGMQRDENARAWDANSRANNQEGRTQQLFPYLLDEQNYAKAKRGMDMLGHWNDFASDVQTPEEWDHLKQSAQQAGVDTSKFDDPNWQVSRRKLQIMTGDSMRAISREMQKADLQLKRSEALKADPYTGLQINSEIAKQAGMLPPSYQPPQSPLARMYGGQQAQAPQQQQAQVPQQQPQSQQGTSLPQVPGIALSQPSAGQGQPDATPGIAPGQGRIVGTAPAGTTPYANNMAVIASLPPQIQAAARAAYAKGLRTGDMGELSHILSTYKSPAAAGADEFGKAAGKQWADFYHGHQQAASTARMMELNLGQFARALDATQGGASTGATAELRMQVANVAQSMGIDPKMLGIDRQNLSNLELLKSLGSQLTANMAKSLQQGEGGGKSGPAARVTDADIRLFTASEPGLDKSPQGNRLLIAILRERNQLQFQLAQAARQAQAAHPNDPIAAQRAYEQLEEHAYGQYEQTRNTLVNQAGFGHRAAGEGSPVDGVAAVRQTAQQLGMTEAETSQALEAIRQNADPNKVIERMRQRSGGPRQGAGSASEAAGVPQGR